MDKKSKNLLTTIVVVILVGLIGLAAFYFGVGFEGGFGVTLPTDLGKVTKEQRDVSGFSKVELSGCGNLFLDQTGEESLEITVKEELLQYIDTYVRGDTLYIEIDWRAASLICMKFRDIYYYVSFADLKGIDTSGSAVVMSEGISAENLEVNISGSGRVVTPLEVENLATVVSGSGTLEYSGEATNQEIDFSGSGEYLAKDLVSETADINVSGLGRAEVNVEKELDVTVSGSGSVYYLGQPEISQEVSGSGKVEQL